MFLIREIQYEYNALVYSNKLIVHVNIVMIGMLEITRILASDTLLSTLLIVVVIASLQPVR